jgi:hypothetical protein
MTLWPIALSPLMSGGHLPGNDAFTLSLLTNDEVLAVNQRASSSRQLFARGNQVAWVAAMAGSKENCLGLFHTGDTSDEVAVKWAELGLPENCRLRDIWTKQDPGSALGGRGFRLAPHASMFLEVSPAAR